MYSSLKDRLSKTLSFRWLSSDTPQSTTDETDGPSSLRKRTSANSSKSSEEDNITTLRRRSTRQLSSEGESEKSTSISQITRSGSSAARKVLSKTGSLSGSGKQLSTRISRPPSRLIEQEQGPERAPSESLSAASARGSLRGGALLSKTPSTALSKQGSKASVTSLTKKQTSLTKKQSLTRSGSKTPVRKLSSVKATPPAPTKMAKPGGKVLWFPAGAFLSVRNDTGGFYLCRALHNVYNTSKEVRVRWLAEAKEVRKQKRKKRPKRHCTVDDDMQDDENKYQLVFADKIEPTSILMQVSMEKTGITWVLDEKDREETERLLGIAEDVEAGNLDKDDIGDDVEEVIIIEPPAKKIKREPGAPREKKPRLKKTASQKQRDKEKKAEERRKKKEEGSEARKRKVPKKEEDLTLHPNPNVKVMDLDPLLETNVHVPYVSKYAHARLAFRAIKQNDMKLLKKMLKDSERVYYLTYKFSVMNDLTPLEYAVKMNNLTAADLLWDDYFTNKCQDRIQHATMEKNLMHRMVTGEYNFRSLGISRIRPIMASRGAREGNNALLKDMQDMARKGGICDERLREVVVWQAMKQGASTDLIVQLMSEDTKALFSGVPEFVKNHFMQNFLPMLLRGHNVQAAQILQKVMKTDYIYRRLPGLLLKVLEAKSGDEIKSVPPSQVTFKSVQNLKGFTLIHAAACNPDPTVLEKVLAADPDFLVADAKGRRAIHFAAGCSSPEPLKLLLGRGANPYDADHEGNTALHMAIMAGRTKNVEILLKLISDEESRFVDPTKGKPNGGVNRADKWSYSLLHKAVQEGHIDIVKLLIEHGADVNIRLSLNKERKTPLMFAAGYGHLHIVRALIGAGAVVELPDRMGRTALIYAAMNGATTVLSYLLHLGASPDRPDTSGNAPLHYAAAYGWYFNVKALLEAGANPAVSNDWRTTPLSVAYLKGHHGIVSILLEDKRVDVNFPDDKGETLLAIACQSEPEAGLLEQIKYLLEEKGADATVVDTSGKTALHHLARVLKKTDKTEEVEEEDTAERVIVDIAQLLVKHGCDPTLRDNTGDTAAMEALRTVNMRLAEYLVEQGSEIYGASSQANVPPNTLLHSLAGLFDWENDGNLVFDFLTRNHEVGLQRFSDPSRNFPIGLDADHLLFISADLNVKGERKNYSKLLKEMAQTYDREGYTPLLRACRIISLKTWNAISFRDETLNEDSCRKWGWARTFIKNLVTVAKSDVNAQVRPRWVNQSTGEAPLDEEGCENYVHPREAKWTPVFFLLRNPDPYWDSSKKFQEGVTYVAFKDILHHGAKVNVRDLRGKTPLSIAIGEIKSVEAVKVLLNEGEADVNMCEIREECKGEKFAVPPLCMAAVGEEFEIMEELLKHPVDVNAKHEKCKSSALHFLAEHRDHEGHLKVMEKIIDLGGDVNSVDIGNETPLHILVKGNRGDLNSSLDAEILLISRKADLNIKDRHGRLPLHYVFRNSKSHGRNHMDPVELCKVLVKAMRRTYLSADDNDGCTPLHYAARCGASICCMYLLEKGAQPVVKNADGNTPLACAIIEKHDSCASILIQQGVEVRNPVVYVAASAEETEKEKDRPPVWKWKPVTMLRKPEPVTKVPVFQEAIKQNMVGTSFLILEKPEEESGITLPDAVEMALKNKQYNVALRMLATTMDPKEVHASRGQGRNLMHVLALSADHNHLHLQTKIVTILMEKGIPADKKDDFGCTPMLYAAVQRNYKLARHLADLPGRFDVTYTDSFGRSLVTAALWNCFFTRPSDELWDWLKMLIEKKADINRKFDYPLMDNVFGLTNLSKEPMQRTDYWQNYPGYGVTSLIFLIRCQDFNLTRNLLQFGANPNMADAKSLTPLMHAVKLNNVEHVKQLLKYDYDPEKDDKEPEKSTTDKKKKAQPRKNVFRLKKMESVQSESDDDEEEEEKEEEKEEEDRNKKREEIAFFWKRVSDLPKCQKEEYIPIKKTSPVNLNATDKNGWTALHHVVCPVDQGTFDNDEMVFVLGNAGAKLNVKNSDGQTPLDLALANNAPKVAAMLQKLMGVAEKNMKQPKMVYSEFSVEDGVQFHRAVPDFHKDADQELGEGEEDMDKEEEVTFVEVCSYCNVQNGNVVVDEDQDLYYEVLMTKCDVRLGQWGLYNFYQIQLVHQEGRDLYVLFTRWGRIGEVGQYQHTPFQSKEAAVKEFCKIFREKSGNKWADVKNFEPKPRKYQLVPWEDRQPPREQKKIEFDLESRVRSVLPSSLQQVLKKMMDVKVLQQSYVRDINVDTDILPFGRFSREKLLQAKALLDEIGVLVNRISKYRADNDTKSEEEKAAHQADCEKVSELSSEYFQLIPQKDFVYEELRPLDRVGDFQKQFQLLTNLLDFEMASRILLGAVHCRTSVNPLDYVYQCLRCKLELMDEEDSMAQCILRYIYASCTDAKVEGIYKVQREGEDERLKACGLDNRRYLWHGTNISNLLSILSRGLVISPLDSNLTGSLFGEGIYFSDLFMKSKNYCGRIYDENGSLFMLLCEVALGQQQLCFNRDVFGKNKAGGYNSIFAPGRYTSDSSYDVRLSTGVTMPLGDLKYDSYNYIDPVTGEQHWKLTEYNEYIVQSEEQVCIRYLVQFRW